MIYNWRYPEDHAAVPPWLCAILRLPIPPPLNGTAPGAATEYLNRFSGEYTPAYSGTLLVPPPASCGKERHVRASRLNSHTLSRCNPTPER